VGRSGGAVVAEPTFGRFRTRIRTLIAGILTSDLLRRDTSPVSRPAAVGGAAQRVGLRGRAKLKEAHQVGKLENAQQHVTV